MRARRRRRRRAGAPSKGRRTIRGAAPLAVTRKLFNWAVARDVYGIEHLPCDRIKVAEAHGAIEPRSRVLDAQEIRAVWRAAGATDYPFGPLVRALLLSGQRLSEMAEARWSEIELDDANGSAAVMTIPSERMKGRIAHTLPLTPTLANLLRGVPRFDGGDFAFSTTSGKRPVSGFSKAKARFDRAVEDAAGRSIPHWTLHDLRRTVRTGLSTAGTLPLVAELVIGHRQRGIAAVYDLHRYDAEKRAALLAWEARLLRIVEDQ
jgi:integrase